MSFVWLGMGIGAPIIGMVSDILKNRKLMLSLAALIGILSTLFIIYGPDYGSLYYVVLYFLLGAAAGSQALTFSVVADISSKAKLGVGVAFTNMFIILGVVIIQVIAGTILSFIYANENTNLVYSLSDYQTVLSLAPIFFCIAFLISIFFTQDTIKLDCYGHILTVISGSVKLKLNTTEEFNLVKGVHCYIPPTSIASLEVEAETRLVVASAPNKIQSRGKKLIIRNEEFIYGCANDRPLRWILTPQYLSRRIFLFHDETLMSRSGTPISWFHTTMFDVEGLPKNKDGDSVFKMSYNNNTEPNICYDVQGKAYVRFAQHPYENQQWSQWYKLNQNTTYYLDETIESAEWIDCQGQKKPLRNKHEVSIENDGYVSLYCIFDPAVTGIEKHSVGEYSQYQFLGKVLASNDYDKYQQEIKEFDQMINNLSLLKAKNLDLQESKYWKKYIQGKKNQKSYEKQLYDSLLEQGNNRQNVIVKWIDTY